MGFKYLGLICLLIGIGACFALWLHAISNRSKTVEGGSAPAEPHATPEARLSQSGYSLAPGHKRPTGAPAAPSRSDVGGEPNPESVGEANRPEPTIEEINDETANTHIELANQFFNMGDFEGVMEMCQLVIDNHAASETQIAAVQELQSRC